MVTLRISRSRRRGVTMPVLGVTAAMALTMIAGPILPAAGEPADPMPSVSPSPVGGDPDTGQAFRVTLLTGDVVTYTVSADGTQSASLDESDDEVPARVYEQDGHVHVIPAEAEPYLDAGVLDPRLFNITLLVDHGYHDAAVDDLPVILVAPDGDASVMNVSASLPGAQHERELPSIDAVSATVDKNDLGQTWAALQGASPAELDNTDATLADIGSVWLNGKVEATLDESVTQVGAPEAWAAGYDGSGVTVAVLDSGYDPGHPDLADQVIGAKDFTGEDIPGDEATDTHGHGTHVASTVAGTGDASDGDYTGVAPGSDLLVGRVLDSSGSGTEDQIITAMEWAVDEGADVVNMSLGSVFASDGTDPMSLAVDRLSANSDALFVVAAGNSGPDRQTVGSPGAATAALTVGAVTSDDVVADFSSRGPRLGDAAIKPEIVAPGAGIVAARAAGTSLGNLRDEHYTALNGTSMATPHVAGAAAILAQQHPEWTGEQLKARLISTSLPLDDEPASAQGAGRLDIEAAIGETIRVSHGALSLGSADGAEPVTRTLTFSNPSDQRAIVRLSGDLANHDSEVDGRPHLRFWRPVLSIPAGGEASTEVSVHPNRTPAGDYTGHIVAENVRDRGTMVRTAISFSLSAPMHELRVTGIDRNGEPGLTITDVWNESTGASHRFFGVDGPVVAEVPEGEYTIVTQVETIGPEFHTAETTLAGRPEHTVDRDVSLTYDAREAEALDVRTARPTDLDTFRVVWGRETGSRSYRANVVASGIFGQTLSVLPGPEARTGTFTFATTWQLVEPLLTAELTGPLGFDITPTPWLSNNSSAHVADDVLPIAYAGSGTPKELAAADVDGKVAVVSRAGSVEVLEQQVEAAEAAGAEFVLAHNDRPGRWRDFVNSTDFPVYLVDQTTGDQLRQALADDPEATLDVEALRDHTYSYQVVFTEPAVPSGTTYDTTQHPTATVVSDYREPSDRAEGYESWAATVEPLGIIAPRSTIDRRGPVERTDYVSTEGVTWSRMGQPHAFRGMYWTSSPYEQYEADTTYQHQWWGPLVVPGTPAVSGLEEYGLPVARFHDAIRISMRHYLYDDTLSGTIFEQMGDRSELTLRRNDDIVGTSHWSEAQFTVPPEKGDFELTLEVQNGPEHFSDTSVRTETTWGFRSERPDNERQVLPLVQVDYDLETGPYNEVPAGTSYPLVIDPGYQPGATGPASFDAAVEVSFDDGQTWHTAPVTRDDGQFSATIPAADQAGFATVRVELTDAEGNSLNQQIDRGWKISPAEG